MTGRPLARNPGHARALFPVTAVAGKTPEPPPRPQNFFRPSGERVTTRYARPARSSASEPARSEAIRSSSVKPAGDSVSVVTPAAA